MKVHMRYLFVLAFLASSSSVSAYQVYGAIGEKRRQLGAESGPLGAPRSDESDAARGGRYNDFQYGFIYWYPNIGAHAVYGLIGEKWNQLGRERGFGYPLTDEQPAKNGGRFNDFESGIDLVVMTAHFEQAAKEAFSPDLRKNLADASAKLAEAGMSKMQ